MKTSMSSATKSIAAYGVYLILFIALPFLFIPNCQGPGHRELFWARVLSR